MQELVGHLGDAGGQVRPGQVAELLPESIDRHHRLGHRPVPPRAADIPEPPLHELPGVPRVAQVAHAHDERAADDAGEDRPLDVLELQEEVGGVRDEVLTRRLAEKRREDLLAQDARLAGAGDEARAARG